MGTSWSRADHQQFDSRVRQMVSARSCDRDKEQGRPIDLGSVLGGGAGFTIKREAAPTLSISSMADFVQNHRLDSLLPKRALRAAYQQYLAAPIEGHRSL